MDYISYMPIVAGGGSSRRGDGVDIIKERFSLEIMMRRERMMKSVNKTTRRKQ